MNPGIRPSTYRKPPAGAQRPAPARRPPPSARPKDDESIDAFVRKLCERIGAEDATRVLELLLAEEAIAEHRLARTPAERYALLRIDFVRHAACELAAAESRAAHARGHVRELERELQRAHLRGARAYDTQRWELRHAEAALLRVLGEVERREYELTMALIEGSRRLRFGGRGA